MEIKPLPLPVQRVLGFTALAIASPILVPLILFIGLMVTIENLIKRATKRKDGWRFAWLPVKCDPWPNDGFKGTVWLERVWFTNNPVGWSQWTREAQASAFGREGK